MVIDPDWTPPPPPEKVPLPEPALLFTVTTVRIRDDELCWVYLGKCSLRATCCGSRAELRFPDGVTLSVRIGGVTGASAIITDPVPLPEIPIGTQVWLLETEECDLHLFNAKRASRRTTWFLR